MAALKWPYLGWIPSVSGWLSFSHSGSVTTSHYVLKASAFNNTLPDKVGVQVLVIHQKRNLSDRPFSTFPLLAKLGSGKRGFWDFFACLKIGEEDGLQTLSGRVWVFSSAQHNEEISKIANEIGNLKSLSEIEFSRLTQRLDKAASEGKCLWYCVPVLIYRNGLCGIGEVARSDTSEESTLRVATSRLCAFEVHSFVKDVFHKHKYHAPDDDTIAPMIEITSANSSDTNAARVEWAKKTTHYLHSTVVNFSRNTRQIEALQDAKGILSYLDSFQKTHQPNGTNPALNVMCLENSIKNSIDKEDFVRKDWRALFAFVTLMLLAPFAAVTGVLKGIVGDPVPSSVVSAYGLTCEMILLGGWYVYVRRAVPMGMGFSVIGRANSFVLYLLISYPRLRVPVAVLSLSVFAAIVWFVIRLLT
jgi:hypothetical protein